MSHQYSDEKNVQVLVALLKAHGIKRIVASPGSANSPLVASMQYDHSFEMFSCVDERSAAYMACGLAAEFDEPVVLTCTGATASRNYLPGITEAFYRKLPVIAITSTQFTWRIGHHVAQVIDRSCQPNDTYALSVTLPIIKDEKDREECELKINDALLQSHRALGGPAHINLQTNSLKTYRTKTLPPVRRISHHRGMSDLPQISASRVSIFVGSHRRFKEDEIARIDDFCRVFNGVVLCDHTSQYHGKFRVLAPVIGAQQQLDVNDFKADLTIHIGEVSGDYYGTKLIGSEVWRVSSDGVMRDTFGRLSRVFEMSSSDFFDRYLCLGQAGETSENEKGRSREYFDRCKEMEKVISATKLDLPFSNLWVASELSPLLPKNSTLHLAILNSLRSWNFFNVDSSIRTASNVGGFGIDGCLSSLLGASFGNPDRLYFCVTGDLAFFYDLNSMGNRHVGGNVRIILINNGLGTEFKTYKHHTSHFGDAANEYICAEGHNGQQSVSLVQNIALSLGFNYFSASDKADFEKVKNKFLDLNCSGKPILLEVFTKSEMEHDALGEIMNAISDAKAKSKGVLKNVTRSVLGEKGISTIKKLRGA